MIDKILWALWIVALAFVGCWIIVLNIQLWSR